MNDIKIKLDKTMFKNMFTHIKNGLGFIADAIVVIVDTVLEIIVPCIFKLFPVVLVLFAIYVGFIISTKENRENKNVNTQQSEQVNTTQNKITNQSNIKNNIKSKIVPDSVKKECEFDIKFYTKELDRDKKECARDALRLGNAYFNLLEIESALQYYKLALEWDPKNEEIIKNIKDCESILKELSK